ncbi:MAG: homoserine O-succinyltransferase [Polyangiaceae bacterium]|jgi:homoserine O-succinyltransferase|nr:homoserine O-succinyltransferase [Polyangiaceae bacterium]
MPLVLPEDHPYPHERATSGPRLRVGIINVMPKLEAYEPLLLGPLSRLATRIEPVFVRLESHKYQSSDHAHLERFYQPLSAHLAAGPLDALVLTGAPVEELELDEVHYWAELRELLVYARSHVPSTLGLCWGGLALAGLLGIPKIALPQKLFGVFDNRTLSPHDPLMVGQAPTFPCAHSRHSGVADEALERAARAGRVRLLSHAPETGYSLFASPGGEYVAHLGHPEYVAERLVFEWRRDVDLGRDDVARPVRLDPAAPTTSWEGHRETFFSRWITLAARARR